MEGLALGASIVNAKGAKYLLTGASSHNTAVEKQFRYPTEYGGQKPPTAQWTVTGAGAAILSDTGHGPRVTSATIGRVVDMGLTDPFNMGGAMAPAAVDTIEAHLRERQIDASYYDLIVTGDLGHVGREIAYDLLHKHGTKVTSEQFQDCGIIIYREGQPVIAGASTWMFRNSRIRSFIKPNEKRRVQKYLSLRQALYYLHLHSNKKKRFRVSLTPFRLNLEVQRNDFSGLSSLADLYV